MPTVATNTVTLRVPTTQAASTSPVWAGVHPRSRAASGNPSGNSGRMAAATRATAANRATIPGIRTTWRSPSAMPRSGLRAATGRVLSPRGRSSAKTMITSNATPASISSRSPNVDTASRIPPRAGPAILASCWAEEFSAIARAKRVLSTNRRDSAPEAGNWKELIVPEARARTTSTRTRSVSDPDQASTPTTNRQSAAAQQITIRRGPNRSPSSPPSRGSTARGSTTRVVTRALVAGPCTAAVQPIANQSTA